MRIKSEGIFLRIRLEQSGHVFVGAITQVMVLGKNRNVAKLCQTFSGDVVVTHRDHFPIQERQPIPKVLRRIVTESSQGAVTAFG
jgi:hypothetical protein